MQKDKLNIFVTIFDNALAAVKLNFAEKQNNLRLLLLVERSGRKKKRPCWVKKGERQNGGKNC